MREREGRTATSSVAPRQTSLERMRPGCQQALRGPLVPRVPPGPKERSLPGSMRAWGGGREPLLGMFPADSPGAFDGHPNLPGAEGRGPKTQKRQC